MTVNEFARRVAQKEGKKIQVNIGQIKELLKVINELTDGLLYKFIRSI